MSDETPDKIDRHWFAMLDKSPVSGGKTSVVSDDRVCGGEACVAGSRIPVWTLEWFRQHGSTDSEILKIYPFSSLVVKNYSIKSDEHQNFLDDSVGLCDRMPDMAWRGWLR